MGALLGSSSECFRNNAGKMGVNMALDKIATFGPSEKLFRQLDKLIFLNNVFRD